MSEGLTVGDHIMKDKFTNPFESGHIKNYILFYVSIVVIMILFFIATTLFNEDKKIEKKVFNTEVNSTLNKTQELHQESTHTTKRFKLLDKAY